jgi:hypothetical protein
VTTPPGDDHDDGHCAQRFRLGNQLAEVSVRTLVPGGTGYGQHPLGRHPTLGLLDTLDDQLGHRIVVMGRSARSGALSPASNFSMTFLTVL